MDALSAAYPPGWSWPAKIFLPAVHPRTFLRAIHLGLMFPLGIASFVFLVVTLAIGGSLIWTLIGPIVLLVGLYVSRWFGDLEAWRVRHVAGIELRRPPTGIERGQSFRQQVWTRLIDPSTWTGLVYLLLQFPIGIAAFVMLVVGGAVAGTLIAAPLLVTLDDVGISESVRVSIDLGFWSRTFDQPNEVALFLVPIGLVAYLLLVHAITLATALHASWARLMLGSRAEPIDLGPARTPPPAPPTDEPPPADNVPLDGEQELPLPAIDWDPVAPALEEPRSLPEGPAATPAELPAAPEEAPSPEAPPREDPVTAPAEPVTLAPARAGAMEIAAAADAPASVLVPELDAPLLVATGEPLDALTTREREVLALIARGYSNAAIAETFVISEGTVKTHVKRVLAKLGLRDRTQAAIYAYETNFVVARSAEMERERDREPIVLTRTRARP
jgi:DNA-binding CsgD family transcriptional regulator